MLPSRENMIFDRIDRQQISAAVNGREFLEPESALINVWADVTVARCEMLNGEALSDGSVHFTALYRVGEEIKKAIHTEHFALKAQNDFITPKSYGFATAGIENLKGYIEAGSLMLSCTVNECITVISPFEEEIITDIAGEEVKTKSEIKSVSRISFFDTLRFTQNGEISLSMRLPEAREIIYSGARIICDEARISAGQLILAGRICACVNYISDDGQEPVIQINDEYEFTRVSDVNGANISEGACVILNADNINNVIEADENGESRKIKQTVDISGYCYTVDDEEISFINDAYSVTDRLKTESAEIAYSSVMPCKSVTVNQRISVKKPEGKPQIARINSVSFSPFIKCGGENKSNGLFGEVSVIYTTAGENTLDGFNETVPFSVSLDEDFKPDNVLAKEIQGTLLSGNEIEIRAELLFTSFGTEDKTITALKSVALSENNDMPEFGIIIYNVQRNETCWDVCKRFGVTEESVLSLNPDISLPLKENDRLYIFRRLIVR